MKRFIFIVTIILFSFMILGCGGKEQVHKTLKVGMSMDFAPFEFTETKDRSVKGFDVDLMKAIAKEMGCEVSFQNIAFDNLLHTLEIGNVDIVISAVSITEERKNQVAFTKPYYESGLVIAVRDNNENIKSFSDLPSKRVGVAIGTTSAQTFKDQKSITVVELPNLVETFHSLFAGNIDAVVSDRPCVDYYLNTNKGVSVKRLPEILKNEYYAIAVQKDNTKLQNELNTALQRIKDKGIYDSLYAKWFGEKSVTK